MDNHILSRKKYCYLPTITLAVIACFITDWSEFISMSHLECTLALKTAVHASVVLLTTVYM